MILLTVASVGCVAVSGRRSVEPSMKNVVTCSFAHARYYRASFAPPATSGRDWPVSSRVGRCVVALV